MDPVWTAIAEFWWIGPTVIGAGTLGWFGLRGQRTAKARRLAYDASRDALRRARQDAAAARVAVRVARAELVQAQAEAAAGRTSPAAVAAARRALDAAQRETRAAAAAVHARRASVSADRVALNADGGQRGRAVDPAQLPLARVMAADDAVTARWMEYETDAARQLAFPTLGDARVQTTAAFLAELKTTRALRPPSADARITPAQFTAYRDGVARLTRAFDAAESEAWRIARREGSAPAGAGPDTAAPSAWITSAQEIVQHLTQTVLARGAEALARATAPRETDPRHAPRRSAPQSAPRDDPRGNPPAADPAPPSPAGAEAPPPTGRADEASDAAPKPPIWPIPSRGTRPPRS